MSSSAGIIIEDVESSGSKIRILRMGSPTEKVVVLDEQRMSELEKAVLDLGKDTSVQGLIVLGNSAQGFCAGADVNAILGIDDVSTAEKLTRRGQLIFEGIAQLSIPTLAAISGPCVGGGCELVLACDARIALSSESTKIGLPEVKLGILPGFGGCQRLPRLIGLPKALDIILKGRLLAPKRALSVGLVDSLVNSEGKSDEECFSALKTAALEFLPSIGSVKRPKLSLTEKFLTHTSLGRGIVKKKAEASILKDTKGHYPAPLEALRVSADCLSGSIEDGLKVEAAACAKLLVSPECKSLVHIYFLTERAKKLGKLSQASLKGSKIGVLGGGVMGAGIAGASLLKGFEVVLCDVSKEACEKAKTHIEKLVNKKRSLSNEAKKSVLKRLTVSDDTELFAGSAFLIEAIVENLEIKKNVLGKLASVVGESCVIASNTSSLSIQDIAEGLPNPQRVVGMHFFNPAEKMPLVEVVRGEQTDDSTTALTAALATRLGKFPVIVEDVPGFLVNRILSPYIAEAGTLLAEGHTIEAIDKAAIDFGMPMGPIRLLDEVGLDVASKVQEEMVKAYGERMKAPDFLKSLVEEGRLGRKVGKGFYIHEGSSAEVDQSVYATISGWTKSAESSKELIAKRLILALVNEAALCFDEKVAGQPGEEAGGQIDLATVMGMGFAPFRGGTLHYAEKVGAEKIASELHNLKSEHGARFDPHPGLVTRAGASASFYEAVAIQ